MKAPHLITVLLLILMVNSCTLDNYDAPNAVFTGSVIDVDTQDKIHQDIIYGSKITYTELGYENPEQQTLNFKSDGSFENAQMFSGTYLISTIRSNFAKLPEEKVEIKGSTEYHFKTKPYIRIKDVSIVKNTDGNKIIATFKLQQVASNPVKSVALLADRNPNVSMGIRKQTKELPVNSVVNPAQIFTVEMETGSLEKGEDYYFRIAALISEIPEATHNYSTTVVRIKI